MLKINQIYKVKEGHEGKCGTYKDEKGKYIKITDFQFDILNKDKKIVGYCECCFTEDDLEPICNCKASGGCGICDPDIRGSAGEKLIEEEVKVECNIQYSSDKNFGKTSETINYEEMKEKSLEDLEVRRDWKKMLEDINELVDNDFGFDLQFDEKEYTDKDVDKMRKIILSTYQISHCVYCKSCQNKYKYQISKQISPSEAETLLEEKLGIKVKIK